MTVSTNDYFDQWTASGSLLARAIPFPALEPEHLLVTVAGVTKTLGTHYTISGNLREVAGSVTATLTPLEAWTGTARIERFTPDGQAYDLQPTHDLRAEDLEYELDRQAMIAAERDGRAAALFDRCVKTALAPAPELPPIEPGKVLGGVGGNGLAWINPGGADSALRADLAANSGAALVTHTDPAAGALPMTQRAFNALNKIHIGLWPDLAAACAEAMTSGRTLVMDGSLALAAPVTINMTGPLHIEWRRRATLSYTGVAEIYSLLRFTQNGHPLILDCTKLDIPAASKIAFPLRFDNDTDTATTLEVRGVHAADAWVGGVISGATASCISAWGKYDLVRFQDCTADGVTRQMNAGVSQAFIASRTTSARGPRRIEFINCGAKDSRTPVNTVADADGFVAFNNDEFGSSVHLLRCWAEDNAGRQIKAQGGSGGTYIEDFRFIRRIAPVSAGISGVADIASQYENTHILRLVGEYEGSAHDPTGLTLTQGRTATTTLAVYSANADANNGQATKKLMSSSIRDVDIRDRTTGGYPFTIGLLFQGFTGGLERHMTVENIKVTGGLVKRGFELGSAGLNDKTALSVNMLSATWDSVANGATLFVGDGNNRSLVADLSNIRVSGVNPIPVNRHWTDNSVVSHGQFIDGGGNIGLLSGAGRFGGTNNIGLIEAPLDDWPNALHQSWSGITKPVFMHLAPGTAKAVRHMGDGWGSAKIKPSYFDRASAQDGEYRYGGTAGTITTVRASTSIVVGSAGVRPTPSGASRELLHWYDPATKLPWVEAIGDRIYLTFVPCGG